MLELLPAEKAAEAALKAAGGDGRQIKRELAHAVAPRASPCSGARAHARAREAGNGL